ncbi:MAG TPA: bifunctional DNA primase/polymerase [Actinocrinis sp.]
MTNSTEITRPDAVARALRLAERGFAVFPLRPGTKLPAVARDWERHATSDPDRLARLIRPARANLAVACGPSGLIVLDLDVAKGPGPAADPASGADALRALAGDRPIPGTFTVATPSGGLHLYFRAPSGVALRNTAGRLGPLIDTRSRGGYVVAPGSVLPSGPYRVMHDAPVADLPGWLLRELLALTSAPPPAALPAIRPADGAGLAAYAAAALRNEAGRVRSARTGTRNDTLNRAAFALGRLVGAGVLDAGLARTELLSAGTGAGLPAREAAATLASGLKAGAQRPWLPPRRPQAAPAGRIAPLRETPDAGRPAARLSVDRSEIEALSAALRQVDRAYDAVARRAAVIAADRDWHRLRVLIDRLRDLRDEIDALDALAGAGGSRTRRRTASLCSSIASYALDLTDRIAAPARRRPPLLRALRELSHAADQAADAAAPHRAGAVRPAA